VTIAGVRTESERYWEMAILAAGAALVLGEHLAAHDR
jgi:hypothetical protein